MAVAATPFRASDYAADNKIHLLIASTGSVATIKLPQILTAFSHHANLSIRVILTPSATSFLTGQSPEQPELESLLAISNIDALYQDADEWTPPWTRGAPILHIELRRWADAMLIAPLSANSLAKVTSGLADGLVASVARAWDVTGLIDRERDVARTNGGLKRIFAAPAMNTAMWLHPVTARHMAVLNEWSEEHGGWVTVLKPVEKELACGDVGGGAMMEWSDIVSHVEAALGLT